MNPGWYDGQYSDTGADNPFGREDLEHRPNAALHDHLRRGNSILTFPRASGGGPAFIASLVFEPAKRSQVAA